MKLLNSFKIKTGKVNSETFHSLALELFHFQANNCPVYQNYLLHLDVDHNLVTDILEIPCLPIDFFKYHNIKTGEWKEEEVYMSSGTTGSVRSKHFIQDSNYYLENSKQIFEKLLAPLDDLMIFALLPSYQEQGYSSLVKMVDHFILESDCGESGGFYLDRLGQLVVDLENALQRNKKVVLFGVGYALLDLVEEAKIKSVCLDGLIIIETGGMKGRRKDMVKTEFYSYLKEGLGDVAIRSEYGMTELLSQAYSLNEVTYQVPEQMRVLIRDPEDPFAYLGVGKTGGINVIDIANVHSCAFIETKDLGRLSKEGGFEILGRLDNSDIRGCNLMMD